MLNDKSNIIKYQQYARLAEIIGSEEELLITNFKISVHDEDSARPQWNRTETRTWPNSYFQKNRKKTCAKKTPCSCPC